jgi:hypothetical protein
MTTNLRLLNGRVVSILFATVGMAAACGGGGGSKPLTEDDFCTQKATKECDGVALNCTATAAACLAARRTTCLTMVTDIETNSPALTFRPENISACVSKTAEIYKKSLITPADRAAVDAVCGRVFSGKKVANDTCATSDFECNTGLICDTTLPVPKCAARTVVSGMFCGNPGETCPVGKYCTGAVGARQCVAQKAEGDVCDPVSAPCTDAFYCPADTLVCTKKLTVRKMCTLDSDCSAEVPYCDAYAGKICDVGFAPSPSAPECMLFGVPAA